MKRADALGLIAGCGALGLGIGAAGAAEHWGYNGEAGPQHWSDLESDFRLCKVGQQESPVDLGDAVHADLGNFTASYRDVPLTIVNNGHTIQAAYANGGTFSLRHRTWQTVQYHFHAPSEHTSRGAHYAMEMHVVHQDAAKNICVLGVFMQAGAENPALATIWQNIPAHEGPPQTVPGVSAGVAALLPAGRTYYAYLGSLTTPPCSENVAWFVLRDPIAVSTAQIARFKAAIPYNARPTQPVGDQRFVLTGP